MFVQPFVRICPLQRIDPRLRLLACVLYCLCLACCHRVTTALVGLGIGFIWLFLAMMGSRPPIKALLKRFLSVNAFLAILWLTTPWTTPGNVLYSIGPIKITAEGLFLALLVTLKANALTCVFIAFLATLDIPSLTNSLRFFYCPTSFILLLVMALRNIHVLADEWERLQTAARLRGFVPKTSLHTFKTLASLLALLLLRSLDRAQKLKEALILRNFNGHFVIGVPHALRGVDGVFAIVAFGFLVLLGGLEFV